MGSVGNGYVDAVSELIGRKLLSGDLVVVWEDFQPHMPDQDDPTKCDALCQGKYDMVVTMVINGPINLRGAKEIRDAKYAEFVRMERLKQGDNSQAALARAMRVGIEIEKQRRRDEDG